jgi:hypothetical protein
LRLTRSQSITEPNSGDFIPTAPDIFPRRCSFMDEPAVTPQKRKLPEKSGDSKGQLAI